MAARRLLHGHEDDDEYESSGFTEEESNTLYVLICFQSAIAIICGLFIVFSYYRFKDLQKRSSELVLLVTISGILCNVSYMLAPDNKTGSAQCTAQGIMMNFWDLSVILWTTFIGYSLYCAVVLQRPAPSRLSMHLAVWGAALMLSLVPLATQSYGDGGPWCWIAGKRPADVAFRFVCFYVPLWACFACNVFLYWKVASTLRRFAVLAGNRGGEDKLTKMANNMRWYPLIFVVAWTANTFIRVAQASFKGYNQSYAFALAHVIFHGSFYQSVGNFFAYGLNGPVRERWSVLIAEMRDSGNFCGLLCSLQVPNDRDENDFDESVPAREEDLEGRAGKSSLASLASQAQA